MTHGTEYDINLRSSLAAREYEAIVRRIARDRPRSILDWGCGWGQVSRMLERAGIEVTAFDHRPREEAGRRPLERYPDLEVQLSPDPVKLPFEDGVFAAVLSLGVLEHVPDPDASLEEIARVLEPGGTLYVFKLPNSFSYTERLGRLAGHYYHGQLPDDRVYTKRSAIRLLESHGFRLREFPRANMVPLNRPGARFPRASAPLWTANRALARLPGLNLLATNLELVARR